MARPLVAGIDEAGRGPVLGPLVVACAVTDDPSGLYESGVRDSKELSPTVRERLEGELKRTLRGFAVVVMEPEQIDRERRQRTLNAIEGDMFVRAAVAAARTANVEHLEALHADAADASESNFRAMLVSGLSRHDATLRVSQVVAEHKADGRYPSVGAASILAKVERDRRVRLIGENEGVNIGSGYPSDPVTIEYLRGYIRARGDVPPFARRSWETTANLLKEAGLRDHSLDQFVRNGAPP